MPKDSRARTRAARARMAATGETYTQARAGLLAPPRMDRDRRRTALVAALMFGELMAAGRRAAIAAPEDLAEAAAAVQAALTPLWPHVVPEAARDVLITCAQIAVSRGVTELPASAGNITAADHARADRRMGGRRQPRPRRAVHAARRLRQLGGVRP